MHEAASIIIEFKALFSSVKSPVNKQVGLFEKVYSAKKNERVLENKFL